MSGTSQLEKCLPELGRARRRGGIFTILVLIGLLLAGGFFVFTFALIPQLQIFGREASVGVYYPPCAIECASGLPGFSADQVLAFTFRQADSQSPPYCSMAANQTFLHYVSKFCCREDVHHTQIVNELGCRSPEENSEIVVHFVNDSLMYWPSWILQDANWFYPGSSN
jgi:hypothetical protein